MESDVNFMIDPIKSQFNNTQEDINMTAYKNKLQEQLPQIRKKTESNICDDSLD